MAFLQKLHEINFSVLKAMPLFTNKKKPITVFYILPVLKVCNGDSKAFTLLLNFSAFMHALHVLVLSA